MSLLNPSGRLSKVEKEGKIFQIQTEFYHRPRPKITSTVIFNGETMNKVDTPWEEQLITDEDLRKIEKALRKQHQRVTQMMESQVAKAGKTQPEESPLVKSFKKLAEIEGVENIAVVDAQGEVLYRDRDSVHMKAMLKLLSPVTKLATFLSQSTRLGNLVGGQLKLNQERIAWVYQKEQLWGALVNQEIDFDSFFEKAKEIGMEKEIE